MPKRLKEFIIASIRIVLLLLLLLVEGLYLNEKQVPPFYQYFQEHKMDQALSGIASYLSGKLSSATIKVYWDKLNAPLNEEEEAIRQNFQNKFLNNLPTHIVILKDKTVIRCKVIKRSKKDIKIQMLVGRGGGVSRTYPLSKVLMIKNIPTGQLTLAPADARFVAAYPDLLPFIDKDFLFLTDGAMSRVEVFAKILRKIDRNFRSFFKPLIDNSAIPKHRMHIVFFNSEEKYRNILIDQGFLEHADGHFDLLQNRLYMYNRIQSEERELMEGEINNAKQKYLEMYGDHIKKDLDRHFEKGRQETLRRLEEQTYSLVRHEAAHMLAYRYGIHSLSGNENPWLVEGLAVYCENPPLGKSRPSYSKFSIVAGAINNKSAISLKKLVNNDSRRALFYFENKTFLAYQQSYALFFLLSQKKYRDNFFKYMKSIRDDENVLRTFSGTHYEYLADLLGTSPEELKNDYSSFIRLNAATVTKAKTSI